MVEKRKAPKANAGPHQAAAGQREPLGVSSPAMMPRGEMPARKEQPTSAGGRMPTPQMRTTPQGSMPMPAGMVPPTGGMVSSRGQMHPRDMRDQESGMSRFVPAGMPPGSRPPASFEPGIVEVLFREGVQPDVTATSGVAPAQVRSRAGVPLTQVNQVLRQHKLVRAEPTFLT